MGEAGRAARPGRGEASFGGLGRSAGRSPRRASEGGRDREGGSLR